METSGLEIAKDMGKIKILIDWVPNNYGAAPVNEDIACVSTGESLEEVKKNILEALQFHADGLKEDGEPIPGELVGDLVPEFELSTRALLKYAGKYITQKALAQETGIAEQQLSHYANGLRHPRRAMRQRIIDGVQSIREHLAMVL